MRARWEALHSSLSASARGLQFNLSFLEAKKLHPLLTDFSDPGRVVAWLHTKDGDLDAKDRLLALLVALAQRGEHRELATTLLWLGLWPGLDGVYRRRLKHFGSQPEELVAELAAAFIALIVRLNLGNGDEGHGDPRPRNTDRVVMDARTRQWAQARRSSIRIPPTSPLATAQRRRAVRCWVSRPEAFQHQTWPTRAW